MYKIGVIPGKFFPPHRGHLYQIINASTKCDKLFVVVSDNEKITRNKCKKDNIPFISIVERTKWMSIEFKDYDNIEVLSLYEDGIPDYPYGCELWSKLLIDTIPDKINVIFGGEVEYIKTYMPYFPNTKYEVFDFKRSRYNISGTEIRKNPLLYWDYILKPSRPFFCKKILITGTESCGKTTLTRNLGKIYHTSWSEEYGRYYSKDFLGGNEKVFQKNDFFKIAQIQNWQDKKATETANKIVFVDTDAVVTQYYCNMYTGGFNRALECYIDNTKWDLILAIAPTVPWVADGLRWNNKTERRCDLHNMLMNMYKKYQFNNIIEIKENSYNKILTECINLIDKETEK